MASLPAPVNVSPVIRFGRWSLLLTGVAYGAFHHSRLSKKEAAIREIEAKQKVVRDAQLAIEKEANRKAELKAIEDLSKPKAIA